MIDFKQDIANILEAADIGLTNDELMKYLEIPQDTKLGDYALPGTIAPIEELQSEESSAALQTALAPLIEYFTQVMANAAA